MIYKLIICLAIIIITFCILINRHLFDGTKIIKNYFQLFKMDNGKTNILLFFTCNIIPMVIAAIFIYLKPINTDIIESIMLIITILASVFLALIGVIIDLIKDNQESKHREDKKEKIKEILIEAKNILLCEIFVSVVELLVTFASIFVNKNFNFIPGFLIYSMIIWIFLNLFILLKRVAFLIDEIIG